MPFQIYQQLTTKKEKLLKKIIFKLKKINC